MSERKSEDEYFKRIEQEQKDKLRAKLDADQAVADKQTLKELLPGEIEAVEQIG